MYEIKKKYTSEKETRDQRLMRCFTSSIRSRTNDVTTHSKFSDNVNETENNA